jgi:predicted nucleic acid-binding protein
LRVALDSNVISALWSGEPIASFASSQLHEARQGNRLLICAPVYAELLAYPKAPESFVEKFLQETGITVDFDITEAIWRDAGRRFSRYASRRRRSGGGHPRRLLVDFLVGAHALIKADSLVTLDRERYGKDFPELQLL